MNVFFKTLRFILLFFIFFLQSACYFSLEDEDFLYFYPSLTENSICQHHLTVVGKDGDAVRARGFTGSVPANATVKLQVHSKEKQTTASLNGRFEVVLPLTATELKSSQTANLIITTPAESSQITYRIRQIENSLLQIPQASLQTGSSPNDFVVAYQKNRPFGVTVASLANELQIFPLDKKPRKGFLSETKTLHFKPNADNLSANPVSLALHEDGLRAAVSLQEHHQIALVDIFEQRILDLAQVENAKRPHGLLFFGNNLLVAFTNLIEAGTKDKPARFGPGILARFIQKESKLILMETLNLPCLNPTHVLKDDQENIWVSCSGVFSFLVPGKITLTSPAAFLKIDIPEQVETIGLKIKHKIDLGLEFSPGRALLTQDIIVAGNSISAHILMISANAKNIKEGQLFLSNHEEKSFFPSIMPGFGNLIFITEFQKDRLMILDMETKEFNPWPFTQGIPLSKVEQAHFFKGPIALAKRRGRPGVDFQAPDMFVLFNLSSELVPLSFLQLMGP